MHLIRILYKRGQRALLDFELNPAQYIIAGFVFVILVGTILLSTPFATTSKASLSLVDAFFMAASATCVTGLSVIDTATDLSMFGQIVIICLVQLGGLGVMSFTTIFAVYVGKKIGIKERLMVKESFNQLTVNGLVKLVKLVVFTALAIQFFGGVLLSWQFFPHYGMYGIYLGFWHAISAFCNAGFDILVNSQSLFHESIGSISLLIFSFLIITGGVGFGVIQELVHYSGWKKLSFHARIVLSMTFALLIIGTVSIFALERNNPATLGSQHAAQQIFTSFFMATSTRTAGFSLIDLESSESATKLFIASQMFIGASPASVGGGVKTTTALVVALTLLAYIKNKHAPTIFEREISQSTSLKAFVVTILSFSYIALTTLLLTVTESQAHDVMDLLFETTSAFATVGLSTGITDTLSTPGKIIITVTMLVGRIGLLTLMLAFLRHKQPSHLQRPHAKILIG
jgi:trk system potassium uptake protein TrkH